MSSNAQTAANIANAQASTGPTTEQGKQRSSQNALKHGLTASAVLIPCEDPAAFEAFRRGLHEHWNPRGNGEFIHVEEMIVIQWRLRRCERIEAVILSADVPDFKTLNNVSLHAARLKRQYSATFKELLAMQERRCNRDEIHLEQAEDIRRADVIAMRATSLKEYGFDFTVEQIDERIRRKDVIAAAVRTLAAARRPQAA